MMKLLKRFSALFSRSSSYGSAQSRELESYLSQAQSLEELENMQRQWDRNGASRQMMVMSQTHLRSMR